MFSVTLLPSDYNSQLCSELKRTLSKKLYDYFDASSVKFWESSEEQIIFIDNSTKETQWGITINSDNRVVIEEFLDNMDSPVEFDVLEA
ncbi:hypothetical protein BCS98_02545 [Vibrio breoganii]|uniref:hypothetical protein n=1 Tax=Vibrio breoganii TaxID=553239 RepID=UPI000C83703F|nr:hypothetical protein [Vibrio breoganii]PML61747.1 hypothetical protein BCT73_01410 [Vibrio breoganii]PMO77417.1 hypothetical protein BCT00_01410 [Vibrio breoganii]PMO89313.1 hypothetical protein BCS98_02545 [Vibrio breoganii]